MEQQRVLDVTRPTESWLFTVGRQLKQLLRRAVRHNRARSLRLCETLSLGDKRFLAVVQVNQEQFLVGGAGNSIALLTRLPSRSAPADLPPDVGDTGV